MEDRVRRLAECFQRVLGDEVESLGRDCGLRSRKLPIAGFVATLVLGWWENPDATRDELAARAQEWFGVTVSPQALSERLTERAAELLQQLLARALEQNLEGEPTLLPILERFAEVFLDDCTTIPLPDDLRTRFPGCGNQVAAAARAGLKALVRLEVRSGALRTIRPGAGREGDAALARTLAPPPPRSLLLFDRGFFDIQALQQFNRGQVFWLTRLPTGLTLRTSRTAEAQPLAEFLTALGDAEQRDARVWLGARKFACRLIACRCAPAVAERRKRRLRQTAQRKGRTPSRRQLLLCEWFVLVTNLPAKWVSLEQALVLYRIRWQIELIFKCQKSEAGLARTHARRGWPRLVELWAKWLARVLEHWVLLQQGGPLEVRSWRLRVRRLRQYVPQLAAGLRAPSRWKTALENALKALACLRPRRPRRKHPGTRELLLNPELIHASLS